ncbi:MAG: DUF362 domain-containing protein [Chthoniobacterales bacterium]|nr:DUF362 domain-containing protein [Chthoniobacterales bacterium]
MSIRFLALLFFGTASEAFSQIAQPAASPAIVYSVREPAAIVQYRTDAAIVRGMVNRLVLGVTGKPDIASAWASLVLPTDKVGIKISAAGGELFTTHRDVVDAIVEGLAAAGVSRSGIIVWDRQLGGTKEAGFRRGAGGYQLLSIEPRNGYDPKATFTAPVMGRLVWGDLAYIPRRGENPLNSESKNTSSTSHFAKLVTTRLTKIINVPTMSDSASAGLAGCLYNMTLPNIDNWRRFTQFETLGAFGMAEIYADPVIRNKVVLHIMDGLLAAYAGGPESHPSYAVHEATMLASKDPVAIDTLALRRIERLRANAKLPPIGELAAHVQIAGQMGLGVADPTRIELRELSR